MNSGNLPWKSYSPQKAQIINKGLKMPSERMQGVPLTEAEARIVAHVCGDGCIYTYICKRFLGPLSPPRKNMTRREYGVSYCNTESSLLDEFVRDVLTVYGRKAYHTKNNEVGLRAKWIYDRLKEFGAGKSREWFIGEHICNADRKIIKTWLRAFFDDEAHVELRSFRITVNSVNYNGLEQVQGLLRKIGISTTTLNGPYFYNKFKIYRLSILKEDVERFGVYVGFNHPKKVKDLEELLDLRALTL